MIATILRAREDIRIINLDPVQKEKPIYDARSHQFMLDERAKEDASHAALGIPESNISRPIGATEWIEIIPAGTQFEVKHEYVAGRGISVFIYKPGILNVPFSEGDSLIDVVQKGPTQGVNVGLIQEYAMDSLPRIVVLGGMLLLVVALTVFLAKRFSRLPG